MTEYEVTLDRVGPQTIAVVRRRANPQELAQVVPAACGTVWGAIRELHLRGAGHNLAVYLDGEINLEVGVEVDAPFPAHGEVVGSTTPAGMVATAAHYGPYDRLHEAHAAIRQWCADHHHRLAGPNWEIYGHWNDDPARLRTDLFYLLQD